MTHPRARPHFQVAITTLDARTDAPTHRRVLDLIGADMDGRRASSGGGVFSRPSVTQPTAGALQPRLAELFSPHHRLQSP
jgi:hypothetical protein